MWLDHTFDYWKAQIVANDQAASIESRGWLVCNISGLTSDLESGSNQGPTILVDFWAPFYALYECTVLVNS